MTVYEYLMKAVQDDARRAGERERLLREARRARRARRQRRVPAAPARRRTERPRRSPSSIGSICKPILRHWPWNRHRHPANMAG